MLSIGAPGKTSRIARIFIPHLIELGAQPLTGQIAEKPQSRGCHFIQNTDRLSRFRLREITRKLSRDRSDGCQHDARLGEPAECRLLGALRKSAARVNHDLNVKSARGARE